MMMNIYYRNVDSFVEHLKMTKQKYCVLLH